MRLLLRSGDHSILRTPAPSCTLLPPTKQVEDRVFTCASRVDSTCPLDPQKRTCAVHWGMSALGQKRTFYSINSSARPSTDGGTARPSAFAVLRLSASSYLVAT